MINLIPPSARTVIAREYWMRVIVAWVFLMSGALLIATILKIPSYFLLEAQLAAYNEQYTQAQLQKADFESAETLIKDTNALALHLQPEDVVATAFTTQLSALDQIAGSGVAIRQFSFDRTVEGETEISISGVATTRSTLARFSDQVAASPLFVEANVPISNLAKDSDIDFTITVVPSTDI